MLLRDIDGDLTRTRYDAAVSGPAYSLRWDHHFALLSAAVLAGAACDGQTAVAPVAESGDVGLPHPMAREAGCGWWPRLRRVTDGVIRRPGRGLRSAASTMPGSLPWPEPAGRSLRVMGVRFAQRRSGVDEIPDELPRTAEKHVSRLLTKTEPTDRVTLGG
ncbi:hypothetical protein [Lentzea sp. NPDC055074]